MLSVFYILPSLFLLCIIIPPLSASGGWSATYGGGKGNGVSSIQQTSDGGYIVAGKTASFSSAEEVDIWVLKLRPNGTVEWQKAYGEGKQSTASSIQQTRDGGYIVAGGTESFHSAGTTDIWVLKLRPDGAVEWQKAYGGTDWGYANSIQQTSDGGYIVAGETESFRSAGTTDIWVLKLRPDGAVEWQKTYGGTDWDYANSIQQTSDGGYVVAGGTESFHSAGTTDIWVLKLRPDGAVEWQKTYGEGKWSVAHSIQGARDGGYIVAGGTQPVSSAREANIWVLKLRPDGTVEWQKTYGGGKWSVAYSIQHTRDDEYAMVGYTGHAKASGMGTIGVSAVVAYVLKLRPDGTIAWQKTYSTGKLDMAGAIYQTSDGGYIVAGETVFQGAEGPDVWILKLRPDGSIDPSCNLIMLDAGFTAMDSHARILDTSATVRDSNTNPRNTSAKIRATNVTANILCP